MFRTPLDFKDFVWEGCIHVRQYVGAQGGGVVQTGAVVTQLLLDLSEGGHFNLCVHLHTVPSEGVSCA